MRTTGLMEVIFHQTCSLFTSTYFIAFLKTIKPFLNNFVFSTISMITASNKEIMNTIKSIIIVIISEAFSKEFGL